MITQRVVWTLLPNGLRSARRARACVLVSPRLAPTPDETTLELSHFPAFQDWPATLSGASFKVLVNGSETVGAEIVSAPDSSIWKAIFPATTFVRPWEFDAAGLKEKVIGSYPAATIARLVENLYGAMAIATQEGEGLPKRKELAAIVNGFFGAFNDKASGRIMGDGVRRKPMAPVQILDRLRADRRGIADRLQVGDPKALAAEGIMADPAYALDLLRAYHTPLQTPQTGKYGEEEAPEGYAEKFPGSPNPMRNAEWDGYKKAALANDADFKNLIDFHQIASALCQYPELCRLCGLVVELEFDRPAQGPAVALQLLPPLSSANLEDVFPKVVVNNAGDAFCAAKKSGASPIVDCYLKLSSPDYSLIQMDVDGAGMKLNNLRESLSRELPEEFDDEAFEDRGGERTPDMQEKIEAEAGLPALRTGGIMLAEKRRDLSLSALFQNSSSMQSTLESASAPPTLYAEDIIRGYRIDILDREVGRWRSLFFRKTDFHFKNTGGGHSTPMEEGMARLAAGGSPDDNNADIIKISEGLASWTGWSLAAPEPGGLIRADEQDSPPVTEDREESPPGLPLETAYSAVPGTLPRLRFGRTYAMRARLVDLAGASTAFFEGDVQPKGAVSEWLTFRRHEPVEPPALALVKEGSMIDRVHDGESMLRLAIRTYNDVEAKNSVRTEQVVRRHVVPSRVSHRFAELHGVMDTGPGGALDASLYPLLVAKDRALQETEIDRGKPAKSALPERYAYADMEFELPYLPDPLAVGVAIRVVGADGIDPSITHNIPLYSSDARWPHAAPFKIVAGEFAMPDAKFDEAMREFRIPMKKAEKARCYVSIIIPKSSIDMMAVRDMIQEFGRSADMSTFTDRRIMEAQVDSASMMAQIDRRIAAGQHWMFTPWRVVEIVHAVQKPLITPQINYFDIDRGLGDTAAKLALKELPLHAKSTAQVDMEGEWQEPVDDPGDLQAAEAPYARKEKAHAFSRKIARNETPYDQYPDLTGKHVFANTNYRRVAYTLHATSRHKEFFDEAIRNDENQLNQMNQLKVTSVKRTGWVPNAAAPPPPKVLYVIPTFGWVRSADGDRSSSLRAGGGLRVYLDRPWMTTGFTEMLGVVLPHMANRPPALIGDKFERDYFEKDYAGSVTMWGADPIWPNAANIQDAAPPLSAFPLARTEGPITFDGSALPAEEGTDLPAEPFQHQALPHPQVLDDNAPYESRVLLDVAPHVVGYDAERRLWYSDVVIRPPSGLYFPFIRLALARYNPISSPRAHLSTMEITEFQQLTPDRLCIVTKNGSSAHVSVHGTAVMPSDAGPSAGNFDVLIQILDAGGDPDLDWRTVAEPKAASPFSAGRAARSRAAVSPTRPSSSLLSSAQPLKLEAERILQSGDVRALTLRPDLALALQPPVIWKRDVRLPPAPNGGKRRILVVEREYYVMQRDDLGVDLGSTSVIRGLPPIGGRIVYMETLDV